MEVLLHFPPCLEMSLNMVQIEQIPSPISSSRNVVIKQPIGAQTCINYLFHDHILTRLTKVLCMSLLQNFLNFL
jgi:hypothetical protein